MSNSSKNKLSAEEYIQKFKMIKHPEGGFFSRSYKSIDLVEPIEKRYKTLTDNAKNIYRSAGSAIYFLLEGDDFSAWHKLNSDEIWHYYDGDGPIDIHVIDNDGQLQTFVLGNPSVTGEASFQVVIRANNWFAAELKDKNSFAFVGCTVSPGFEYIDFVMADKNMLVEFPEHKNIISKLIRG